MELAYTTTTADDMAQDLADFTAFTLGFEFEAADPSTEGASMADAMATIGTLDLTDAAWVSDL